MNIRQRNNVKTWGNGPATLMFAHGFGCDQSMWRLLLPALGRPYRIVVFDAVGSGASDWRAYDPVKYGSLQGYAQDVLEIAEEFAEGSADRPVVFVGHSVASMVGLLAAIREPGRFAGLVMVSPSPCYLDDGDYRGGFTLEDIEDLLQTLADNYTGWARAMAPVIMGAPAQPDLSGELVESFCRADPAIAAHFARVTFLSDHRPDLPRCPIPTLILQCTRDIIAPRTVGEYTQRALPASTLRLIDNVGHCPHMSAPHACAEAIDSFVAQLGR